jgi:flagellar hook-associated protein 2
VADISGTIAAQLKLTGEADGANLTGKANYQFNTVNSLIRKVQLARDADGHLNDGSLELALSADGKGIAVTDHSTGAGTTQVESLNGSRALEDLGLTGTFQSGVLSGDRLASGLNTVLLRNLNGGTGVRLGVSSFQLRDGSTRTVDFAGTQTLQDAVNRINATGLMRAEIAAGGTSVVITDTTVGTGSFVASGDTLADLQLEGTSDSGRITGGDLNRKYISESTKLSALNGGKGIGLTAGDGGSVVRFDVTNTAGLTETVVLSGSQHQTVGDVINTLNEVLADKGIQAAVNSAGDGIELFETSPAGAGQLKVADIGSGTVAASLHLAGEASAEHPSVLTGSFAGQVEIGPADTLNDVMDKINEAKLGVRASVLSDGSSGRPYRLVISSDTSGTAGQMAFHTGTSGLGFETLAEAQDARVVVGSIDSPNSIVVSSSSNKVTGVVTGMTLDLAAPSDTAVQVSVTQNVDGIVSSLNTFITAYNATLDRIDELTKYDSETQEKGVLLGDSTIAQVRDRLYRQVSRVLPETYSIRQLSSVGISFSTSGGGKLELDETKLRQAIEDDPTGVKDLFTKVTTSTGSSGKEVVNYVGIAATLKQELKSLTTSSSGLLTQATTRLDDRIELYTNRIDDMQTLLDKKEARYYAQFQAMETALSKLQTQQSALGSLSSLAGTVSTSTSSSKG